LRCGELVLSEADNWYVPARLTPEMNRLLETTDTPFGVAVQSLHFQRHTLSAELLWQPFPADWGMKAGTPGACAGDLYVSQHVLQPQATDAFPCKSTSTEHCSLCPMAHPSARWSRPTRATSSPSRDLRRRTRVDRYARCLHPAAGGTHAQQHEKHRLLLPSGA